MTTLPSAQVRARLSEVVDTVEGTAERVVITRNGVPAAVLLSVDDLASMEETLAWLDGPGAVRRAQEADEAVDVGDVSGRDEVAALIAERAPLGVSDRYELVLGASARRALVERLPERMAAAVWTFCDGALRDAPHLVGTPLRAPFLEQYSARRGAYRARYRIDDDERVVAVVDIAYRADAHRA